MGALPKTKISRHRRGNRRRHLALTPPTLVTCQTCGSMHRAHHVCKACGSYRGRQVLEARGAADND